MFKTYFSRYRINIILILLCLSFFFVYSFFSFSSFHKYSSPDETANHFFSKQYIEKGNFKYGDPLINRFEGIVRPRSFSSDGHFLIPSSFLGLPLFYGLCGKLFGQWIIYFIGPLIAVLSVFFFHLFLKRIFTEKQAFFASLLLFIQPVFVFYAMRPFWHNGLFVGSLIISLYFLISLFNGEWWRYLLFGLTFGFVIITRTSEIVWLLPIFLLIIIFNFRRLKLKYTPLIFIGMITILLPLLYYQWQTYGSALTTGYLENIYKSSGLSNKSLFSPLVVLKMLLPYGIRLIFSLKVFYSFSIMLMFTSFTLGLLGTVLIFRNYLADKHHRLRFFYCLYFIFIAFWLLIYYGSYEFYEYFNRQLVAIGVSYARYWLPLYVFSLPLGIVFIEYISQKIYHKLRKLSFVIFISLIVFCSVSQILLDPYYGLKIIKTQVINQSQSKLDFALENTPKNAIIIAGQNDKIYWPDRKVIGYDGLAMPSVVIRNIPDLFKTAPIYYDCWDKSEISRLNELIRQNNLVFIQVDSNRLIYKLSLLNYE